MCVCEEFVFSTGEQAGFANLFSQHIAHDMLTGSLTSALSKQVHSSHEEAFVPQTK